ncbi:hypothetical protein DFA_09560 [Cavenderia fasciculata]|uniref:Uncharacterized protein n=1 Tax=Cavenderia fasciculata TaxID=261658 RepID=F4Q7Z1_CACFS|nr:uncharacterized protein DFA_09560 [Cavenderia fasciculata]EGG15891.1 hypothetical protein DFA_09560 [Cavenderia fasciculata]|eukprot:XP_004352216.1 hypothetical protein DFA_09560 [Cavenderia fasciculata]
MSIVNCRVQYSSTIQENEAAICSSGNFICSTGTPRHIAKIILVSYDTTIGGMVCDPLLTALDFQEMEEIQIVVAENPKSINVNILT